MEHYETQESGTYRTGSTNPPKKSGCLFAFILIILIFTIGIVSSLGLVNIRLWRNIDVSDPNETVSIVVSDPAEEDAPQTVKICIGDPLGIQAESISILYQMYYNLPNGLHITYITPDSPADQAGLAVGDILLRVDDTPVTSTDELNSALNSYAPGDEVTLTVYRSGKEYSVSVTLGEAHG